MHTVYATAASLDGFIADPDHGLEWLLQHDVPSDDADWFASTGALAMGSSTYDWLVRHLAATGEAWPYAQPVWVFSSRARRAVEGADLRFVSGDVRPVHAAMAAAASGRDLWIVGGGDLAGQFLDAGLLDEVVVSVAPVTLGAGMPLLPRRADLRLRAAEAVGGVFARLTYEVPRDV